MKIAEIKQLTDKELAEMLEVQTSKYTKMLLNHAISPEANPIVIKENRRTIARIKTIIRERAINK